MKKQIVSIFAYSVLGLSAVMVSCGDSKTKEPTKTENSVSEMAFLRADIDGMTCAIGCAKPIEKMLSETEGVSSAEVDFDKKAAFINYDKSKVSEADLLKKISEYKDGTYKAITSTKQCKSECKKTCCAAEKVEKQVKKVASDAKTKVEKEVKNTSMEVKEVIVEGATKASAIKVKGTDAIANTKGLVKDTKTKALSTGITKKGEATTKLEEGKKQVHKSLSNSKVKVKTLDAKVVKETKKIENSAKDLMRK